MQFGGWTAVLGVFNYRLSVLIEYLLVQLLTCSEK